MSRAIPGISLPRNHHEYAMKKIILSNNDNGLPLPPANTARWVKSRKMAVVKAIETGIMTDESACQYYGLSAEELASWKTMLQKFGPDALRSTHLRRYRQDAVPATSGTFSS